MNLIRPLSIVIGKWNRKRNKAPLFILFLCTSTLFCQFSRLAELTRGGNASSSLLRGDFVRRRSSSSSTRILLDEESSDTSSSIVDMGTTIKVVDMLKERLRREEGKKRALTLHKVELESMLMNKIIKAEIVDETNDLPPIYWINLDDSVDRRKAMMDMFSSMGISNAHRVSAVNVKDAKSMWQSGKLVLHPDVGLESIEDKAVIWEKKNQHIYSYREAAALLSHLSAIKQAYEARHDYAMIVEDDARITSTFQDEWRGYVDLAPSGWKILQFANSNGAVVRQGAAITEPFISWQPYHWCARAYLINRSGMKTLMDKAYSSSSSSSSSTGHQGIWHIDEAPMVVADEVVYGYTGGAYTSTGLWVDGFNLDSTIQVDDNPNSFVMTSYLQSIVGDPAKQIAMKKSPNMSYEESLLVLMSVKIQNENDIAKEIQWIQEDYSSVCKFYSTCEWMVNVVAANDVLRISFEEATSKLPPNISITTSVSTETFNKYMFVQKFIRRMKDYDLVLLKDNDMRIDGFPWQTFVEKKKDAIVSAPLQTTTVQQSDGEIFALSGENSKWLQLYESSQWTLLELTLNLFAKVEPVELPFLGQSFVLMDAKFANFFFNLALRPTLISRYNDWGPDHLWCAASKAWDSSRPGCYLIPVVSNHEDTRQVERSVEYNNWGQESLNSYEVDPILGRWVEASSTWLELIGGKYLNEIEQACRREFSLKRMKPFELLQICATKASRMDSFGIGDETLRLIMDELNKSKIQQSEEATTFESEDAKMLKEAMSGLVEHLHELVMNM